MKYKFALLLLLVAQQGLAQCYDALQRPYYPDPFTGGFSVGNLTDDVHSDVIDIGFDFCFFGDTVNEVVVSSNGYISFDTSLANGYSPWNISEPIPSPNSPLFSIMGPYQDLNPNSGIESEIRYATYGVPPYRRFVVSFDQVSMFSCVDMLFSNQMVMYESANVIDINIADKPLCENWNGGAAIEGIHNQDGTEAYVVSGRNFPEQWSALEDSYRFIPTCDCPTDSLDDLSILPGKVYWDTDGDCTYDADEYLIPNVRIDIEPGNGTVWTNQAGEFGLLLDPGNYTLSHSPLNPFYYINTCNPDPIEVTMVADSNALDIFFGDSVIPYTDVEVNVASSNLAACFPAQQYVSACNNGTIPANDLELTVTLPGFLQSVQSDLTNVSDSTWLIAIDTLMPGQCLYFTFTDTVPCDSSMIGAVGCMSASITVLEADTSVLNNTDTSCIQVGTSYDPNDKRVKAQNIEEGWLTEEYIDADDELTYMIRFQNTGTAPAYNVIIQDELSEYLDHQSIDPVMSSHDYYMQMIDGMLSINFLGIELPDSASDPLGSQGFIEFMIKQNPGNPLGTVIENQAEIYFDFNAPVATNTTVNEIPLFISVDDLEENELVIYPNPVLDQLTIDLLNQELFDVMILDVLGRPLKSITDGAEQVRIDVSDLDRGTYLIQISTNENQIVERFIKR